MNLSGFEEKHGSNGIKLSKDMVNVNSGSRNYTMFETKYIYDLLTVSQQIVYSRLLSSRKNAEGRVCDIANIACCSHKLWFHKIISVSKHMTSQAETEKSTKMKLLYARELSTDEAINELCYIQR